MIDWDFISNHEGGRLARGYVPTRHGTPIGKSGVTIATGIDLGAISAAELAKWALAAPLQQKLVPYVGVRGMAALTLLTRRPLVITEAEARSIDLAVSSSIVETFKKLYDGASAIAFDDLSDHQQTAIIDLVFQYGPHLNTATPKFWHQITTQDWTAAINNLRNFNDQYTTRRHAEADLMEII